MRSMPLFVLLLLAAASLLADDENPFQGLPMRVLPIEGGTVGFQGFAMWDGRDFRKGVEQASLLKYVLVVYDNCDFPIWTQIDWKVPDQKPFNVFGKVAPGMYREAFVNTKRIKWDTPIPVQVTIYSDEKKSHVLGGRAIVMRFDEERERFEQFVAKHQVEGFRVLGESAVVSGFDDTSLMAKVAGTKFARWERSIKLMLLKQESQRHWDCAHEVTAVQARDPQTAMSLDELTIDGKPLTEDVKQFVEDARMQSSATFEEWQVKSCDDVSVYLVVVVPLSEKGDSANAKVMKLGR